MFNSKELKEIINLLNKINNKLGTLLSMQKSKIYKDLKEK